MLRSKNIYMFKSGKRYFFTLYVVVCASPLLDRFLFSRPIPAFDTTIPALYAEIPCYLVFYVQYRARCASGGGPIGSLEASLDLYMLLIRQAF